MVFTKGKYIGRQWKYFLCKIFTYVQGKKDLKIRRRPLSVNASKLINPHSISRLQPVLSTSVEMYSDDLGLHLGLNWSKGNFIPLARMLNCKQYFKQNLDRITENWRFEGWKDDGLQHFCLIQHMALQKSRWMRQMVIDHSKLNKL